MTTTTRPTNADDMNDGTLAEPERWNAWRYPTEAEIAEGREEHDMVWLGAGDTESEAARLLPKGESGTRGQLQFGLDGAVVNP